MADTRYGRESRDDWRSSDAPGRRESIFEDDRERHQRGEWQETGVRSGFFPRRATQQPASRTADSGAAFGDRGPVGEDARQSRDSRFGGARAAREPQARSGRSGDALYREWRDRQVAEFDRDYEDYRRERQQRFHHDFENWRRGRQGSRQEQEGAATPGADRRPGIERETAETNVTRGAGQADKPAAGSRSAGRNRS